MENLLNPSGIASYAAKKNSTREKKKPSAKKKIKRKYNLGRRTAMPMLAGIYDVVAAFTNSQSGITTGQLWKGDGASAKKEVDHVSGKGKVKVRVMDSCSSKEMGGKVEENCLGAAPV